MNTANVTLAPREIEQHVAYIGGSLGKLGASDGDVGRFAKVGERLQMLRSQYRAQPESLDGCVPRLRELSRQFDALLESRLAQIVDRFHEINEQIRRAQCEKEFWREYLIQQAPPGRRETLSGSTAEAVIRSSKSRLLPAAGTEPRAQLEGLVQETGRWGEVSQLSRSKLQRALDQAWLSPAQQRAIAELCPLEVVHQVSSRPRTT